jgi:eukaryotic-like serine/threonine-protein kinase
MQLGGRYRLVDELGRGGMARVWRAVDEVLGRMVAVKVLAPGLTGDRGFLDRFRVEARAAAQLAHPNIAGVFDYGEWDLPGGERVACIVLELLEGSSLAARLRQGPLPWPEAVAAAAQVAQALAVAHRRGVVHRDVKPGNVVLTRDGAKVLDFGIAAMAGEPERRPAGGLLGTAVYVAPELRAGGVPTPAADVYGLGVLLFESLTGQARPPRLDGTLGTVPELPAEVAELARRCVAARPQERPSSATVAELLTAAAAAGSGRAPAGAGAEHPAAGASPAGGDTALLLGPVGDDRRTRVIPRSGAGAWLAGGAVGAAVALAVVLAVAPRPAGQGPPATTAASAPATTTAAGPAIAGTAADSLERVRRSIDEGVAAGQIRPDVGTDLDNLVGNLRGALTSDRRGDLPHRIDQLQGKLQKRLGEPGAITPAGAEAVSLALGELARSLPSP